MPNAGYFGEMTPVETMQGEGGGPEKVPDFESSDPKLCAYDNATGNLVGEVALPRNVTGASMTYMLNGHNSSSFPLGTPICWRNLSRFAYDDTPGSHAWLTVFNHPQG